jgi:tRNA/tmRNA/rRNA uracil-C5-methylase (TrmA/RlmC/RlmD family)
LGHYQPLCPVFGQCGGCQYQHLSYPEELTIKNTQLQEIFSENRGFPKGILEPVIPAPGDYHYRSRLDLKLIRTRDQGLLFGFSPSGRNRMVPTTQCFIAMPSIAAFLPELKRQAIIQMPLKYRTANLVVKTGDDQRVCWGGIGRKSLTMKEQDYLWTVINGKKIFYSLDTFFQANLAILPTLVQRIQELNLLTPQTIFYDLYGGVGLFGIAFAQQVKKVVLVEENNAAVTLARYNREQQQLNNMEIIQGRVEDHFRELSRPLSGEPAVIFIDPPRKGLDKRLTVELSETGNVDVILYLSCNPQALCNDLMLIRQRGWQLQGLIPFDFFPRTHHVEILAVLKRYQQQ